MTRQLWRTLGGQCIFTSPTGASVYQNYFYRWLTLDSDAVQSLINKRYPHKPSLQYVRPLTIAARAKPGFSCMLGLGGAGVAHFLMPHLASNRLTAVELDADIIKIAADYFMTLALKNLDIQQQDASEFIKYGEYLYQHILVDLFGSHSFPAQCNTKNFFINCKNSLTTGGILAINLADVREQGGIFEWIRDIFQCRTVVLPVKKASNIIILACNGPSVTPLLALLEASQELKKLSWGSKWGWVGWLK